MRLPAPPRSQRRVTPLFALVVPKTRSDLVKMIRGTGDVKRLGRLVFRMDNIGSIGTNKSSGPITGDLLRASPRNTFLYPAGHQTWSTGFGSMAAPALPLASFILDVPGGMSRTR